MSKLESNRWPTAGSRDARAGNNDPGTWDRNPGGDHPLSVVFTPDEKKKKDDK